MPATATATGASAPAQSPKKAAPTPDKKYKCQFCARAFSRSEHRSRHERSRKFLIFFIFFWVPLVGGGVTTSLGGASSHCAQLWLIEISTHRHQRTPLQMHEMSQHLRQKRSAAAARSHCPCQRWRRPSRQRSQAAVHGQGHPQADVREACGGTGYSNAGTDRSKQ